MKNWFCLALAVFMGLSLCACGGSGESGAKENTKGLQVGYAREKIMPNLSQKIPMGGYGNTDHRMAQNVLDYLYITCIAMTEGDQTVLLFTQDLTHTYAFLVDQIREKLTAQTGIPGVNILVASTHSHATPSQDVTKQPGIQEYNQMYVEAAVKAATDALADRADATMYGGDITVDGMNFVRHYLMNDGTYSGSNFGSTKSGYKDHATPNDPTMGLLKFEREGDKADILLMNWAAHATLTGGMEKYDISADYIGAARTAFESATGMQFAFFLSAAGNQATDSWMPEKANNLDHNAYGQKLAQAAVDALPSLTKLEGSGIQTAHTDITYALNREDVDKLQQAQEVADMYKSTGDRTAAGALAKQYGLTSVYHANSIVNRSKNPDGSTDTFRIHATRIGDFAFINAPYEMFCANAVHIRDNSPFAETFVITCSNDAHSYFPTREAFEYGCYESYICRYARGIAEDTADAFVKLLNDIK